MFVCSLLNALNSLRTQKSVPLSFALSICLLILCRHNTNQATVLTCLNLVLFSEFKLKEFLRSTDYTVEYVLNVNIYKCLFISNKVTNI
jgi:hypothetical protein